MSGRRLAGRGALACLALMLAGSGALRLGDGMGAALAARTAMAPEEGAGAPLDCPAPPLALAEALRTRTATLDAREAALDDRAAALALAGEVAERRLAELEEARLALEATLVRADGAMEADLARLTEVYQTMKPKDAAALFATMDPDFAAGFLSRMRPDAAAAVLAGMPPDVAYSVSVLMAGRHARVPLD